MPSEALNKNPLISFFSLRRYFFLLGFAPYLLLYLSVFLGQESKYQNLWMLFPCAVIFIVIPILDRLIGLDEANPDEDQQQSMKQEFWYQLLPALVLPLQGFTLFWAVEMFHSQELSITGKLS